MAVVMNKKKWDSLPDPAKKAIDEASGMQWGLHAAQVYDDHDGNALKEIKKQGKIEVYELPKSETKKFKKELKALEAGWIDDMSKRGFPAKTSKKMLKAVRRSAKKNR